MTPKRFDLVVIGAGINGAGIARQAARAGLSVAVLERGDVGGGTTSASTRLIHGGLRYLEYGEFGLVYESLREREALLRVAPHLVEPLELCLPVYRGAKRPRWQIRLGLAAYDLLSWGKSLPRRRALSRDDLLAKLPGLAPNGLVGGAAYYDAQITYPERLVVENLLDAAAHGAELYPYTEATRIVVAEGAVRGVEFRRRDGLDNDATGVGENHDRAGRIEAAAVVNAAGPWLDRVVERIDGAPPAGRRLIGGTKGSHLVVAPFPGAPAAAVYAEAAQDARPFFIVPWNGLYLIGTTDERFDGDPGKVAIDRDERAYLVAETERLFPGAGLDARVCYAQAGVRALPFAPGSVEGAITRRHLIHAHDDARGLYSVVGGKLTTYRSLAAIVIERLARDGALSSDRRLAGDGGRSRGEGLRGSASVDPIEAPLPGAIDGADRTALERELAGRFGAAVAARWLSVYGRLAVELADAAERSPELAEPVTSGSALLKVELVHALDAACATTLVDVLHRRTMVGLGADFGMACAPAAATALVQLGRWDRARAEGELAAYAVYAARHGVAGAAANTAASKAPSTTGAGRSAG